VPSFRQINLGCESKIGFCHVVGLWTMKCGCYQKTKGTIHDRLKCLNIRRLSYLDACSRHHMSDMSPIKSRNIEPKQSVFLRQIFVILPTHILSATDLSILNGREQNYFFVSRPFLSHLHSLACSSRHRSIKSCHPLFASVYL
jgi:hypothetical protein